MTIHSHQHDKQAKLSRLKIVLILTSLGMFFEFIGGFLSNSLALISDAWHMLTHIFALGMSYFTIILSCALPPRKGPTVFTGRRY